MSFHTAGVKGFSGCNDFAARYRTRGRLIYITQIERQSARTCGPELADQEKHLFEALERVWNVDLSMPGAAFLRMGRGVPVMLRQLQ